MLLSLFQILIFPGFLFLVLFSFIAEYFDRKFHARLQNRIGPPWFQPVADFIKLISKQNVIPEDVETAVFIYAPVLALTATLTAYLYIPIWNRKAVFSFYGDVIVVIYLLTIPTLSFFLGGWRSTSIYSMLGAVRSITQLFAYEVPLFIGILSAALLANTWSLSEMTVFYSRHPAYCLFNIVGFAVSIVVLLGKLEKVPFDIPEAETEIVAGTFTEYSGKLLGIFRMAINIEMLVCASLLAAVFLPFGLNLGSVVGFVFYLLKILFIIILLTVSRTVFARLRLDQMMNFFWKYAAPAAFFQLLMNLIIKEII